MLNNFNFIFSNFTNKNLFYFSKFKNLNFFKFLPLSISFFDETITKPNTSLSSYQIYEKSLYFNFDSNTKIFDISTTFETIYFLILKKIIEIKKILIILFFFSKKNKINSKMLNNFVIKFIFFKKTYIYISRI